MTDAQASASPTPAGPPASAAPSNSLGPVVSISPGIAFYSNAADATGSTDAELYNIDPVTGKIDQLTFNTLDDRYPGWSPDYKQLTFSRRVGTDSRDVFRLNLANLEASSLVTGDTWDWNSTGRADNWIAYVHGDPRELEPSAIWAIRPDGSGAHQIVAGTRLRGPAWKPDGRSSP